MPDPATTQPDAAVAQPFELTLSLDNGTQLNLKLSAGQRLFVLGANGTGKSALIHKWHAEHDKARRISAHRQTWFSNQSFGLSYGQMRQMPKEIRQSDVRAAGRWQDDYAIYRPGLAIVDLIDAENARARSIAAAVDARDESLARTLSSVSAPLKTINELLRLANIPISLATNAAASMVARKSGSEEFDIAQLSDGERSAILIAADILTAQQGSLILVDEPERHLHRAIISPLLTLLFAKRNDCVFVISTHEVMLPIDDPTARTLLIRGCTFKKSSVSSWDADLIESGESLGEDVRRQLLGARRTILFVEGKDTSLDKPLYSLLFPNVSVLAKESSRDVEEAVRGLRDAADVHWVRAFGIVDNDGRTQQQIDDLKARGVYATPVYSVESLYYDPEIQLRVKSRYVQVIGGEAATRVSEARSTALKSVAAHSDRLAKRVVEKTLRSEILRHLPGQREIAAGKPFSISVDIADAVATETRRFKAALDADDLTSIIARYPIRKTPALEQIIQKLGFQDRDQYESAVRQLLLDDPGTVELIRSQFGSLYAELTDGKEAGDGGG
jgi:ABC-type lipoprotein export system ATPase subunit